MRAEISPQALAKAPIESEEEARAFVERLLWPEGPHCPRCNKTVAAFSVRRPKRADGGYECKVCRKHFTVKSQTIFAKTPLPWVKIIEIIRCFKSGIHRPGIRQVARDVGVDAAAIRRRYAKRLPIQLHKVSVWNMADKKEDSRATKLAANKIKRSNAGKLGAAARAAKYTPAQISERVKEGWAKRKKVLDEVFSPEETQRRFNACLTAAFNCSPERLKELAALPGPTPVLQEMSTGHMEAVAHIRVLERKEREAKPRAAILTGPNNGPLSELLQEAAETLGYPVGGPGDGEGHATMSAKTERDEAISNVMALTNFPSSEARLRVLKELLCLSDEDLQKRSFMVAAHALRNGDVEKRLLAGRLMRLRMGNDETEAKTAAAIELVRNGSLVSPAARQAGAHKTTVFARLRAMHARGETEGWWTPAYYEAAPIVEKGKKRSREESDALREFNAKAERLARDREKREVEIETALRVTEKLASPERQDAAIELVKRFGLTAGFLADRLDLNHSRLCDRLRMLWAKDEITNWKPSAAYIKRAGSLEGARKLALEGGSAWSRSPLQEGPAWDLAREALAYCVDAGFNVTEACAETGADIWKVQTLIGDKIEAGESLGHYTEAKRRTRSNSAIQKAKARQHETDLEEDDDAS